MRMVIVALLLAAGANGPLQSRPKYKVRMTGTLTSLDANCVMFHPAQWGGDSPVIRGPIPGPTEGGVRLQLEWVTGSSEKSVEEQAGALKQELGKQGATLSADQSFPMTGRPAVQFEASFDDAEGKRTALYQLVKNGETLLVLKFAAEAKVFHKRWHEVNLMFRSLKWFRRVELTQAQKDKFLDLYEQGFKELAAGRAAEALKLYKECADIVSEIGAIQSAIGRAHIGLKDYRSAVVAMQNALKLEPDNTVSLWQLALSYYLWGKEEDAIQSLKRVMDADPDNEEAFLTCGILYANKKKWFDAKDAWKRGAQKNPDDVNLHFAWGQAAEMCEKWSEAKDAYERTLKLQPGHGGATQRLEVLKKRRA